MNKNIFGINVEIFETEKEWLDNRKGYIGGTGSSCILGLNSYKNNVQYYNELIGKKDAEDISDKDVVIYGKKAEHHLVELMKLDYPELEIIHLDYNSISSEDENLKFIKGSLDGICFNKETNEVGFIENKTTLIRNNIMSKQWDNKIPMIYFIQVLHYFLVEPKFKFCILKVQMKYLNKDEPFIVTKHYKILRQDYLKDIEYLRSKLIEFNTNNLEPKIEPNLILPKI